MDDFQYDQLRDHLVPCAPVGCLHLGILRFVFNVTVTTEVAAGITSPTKRSGTGKGTVNHVNLLATSTAQQTPQWLIGMLCIAMAHTHQSYCDIDDPLKAHSKKNSLLPMTASSFWGPTAWTVDDHSKHFPKGVSERMTRVTHVT